MSISFYCGSGSPYAWRVWLALEHKQLPYDLKMLSFSAGDLSKDDFIKLNPRRKVPVIVDGDFVLYESVAIVEYLDERYPNAGQGALFPRELHERAIARRMIQEADHYLVPAIGPMLHEVFFKPASERDTGVIADSRAKFASELGYFERALERDFLAGPLSAADYTLYPMLALALRADLKQPDLDIRGTIGPRLDGWMRRIEALPFYEQTVPPHWKST
jgi:glutathione S-transferase